MLYKEIFVNLKNEPLFNRVEITTIKNHKWTDEEDKTEYIGEVKIVSYYDFNNEPLKEVLHIISKKRVEKNFNFPPPSYNCSSWSGGNSGGIIDYKEEKKEPTPIEEHRIDKIIDYTKPQKAAIGGGIGGIICGVIGAAVISNPTTLLVGGCIVGGALVGAFFGWNK